MSRPQVTGDKEHERLHDEVAATGVAKDAGMVWPRAPHPSRPGTRRSTVRGGQGPDEHDPQAGPPAQARRDRDSDAGAPHRPGGGSGSSCRGAAGLAVQPGGAAQAKNLPSRPKTDRLDAQRLARLTEMGMLRASFVPPKAIRGLRDYTRMRARLA